MLRFLDVIGDRIGSVHNASEIERLATIYLGFKELISLLDTPSACLTDTLYAFDRLVGAL